MENPLFEQEVLLHKSIHCDLDNESLHELKQSTDSLLLLFDSEFHIPTKIIQETLKDINAALNHRPLRYTLSKAARTQQGERLEHSVELHKRQSGHLNHTPVLLFHLNQLLLSNPHELQPEEYANLLTLRNKVRDRALAALSPEDNDDFCVYIEKEGRKNGIDQKLQKLFREACAHINMNEIHKFSLIFTDDIHSEDYTDFTVQKLYTRFKEKDRFTSYYIDQQHRLQAEAQIISHGNHGRHIQNPDGSSTLALLCAADREKHDKHFEQLTAAIPSLRAMSQQCFGTETATIDHEQPPQATDEATLGQKNPTMATNLRNIWYHTSKFLNLNRAHLLSLSQKRNGQELLAQCCISGNGEVAEFKMCRRTARSNKKATNLNRFA